MQMRTVSAILMVVSVILFGLAVASCAPDTAAPTLIAVATSTATEVAALPQPVSEVVQGVAVPTLQPFTDTECLNCHTNQEQLEVLALPEEDSGHESLSSGPG